MAIKEYIKQKKDALDKYANKKRTEAHFRQIRKDEELDQKAYNAQQELKRLKAQDEKKAEIKKLKDYKKQKFADKVKKFTPNTKGGIGEFASLGNNDGGLGGLFSSPKSKSKKKKDNDLFNF